MTNLSSSVDPILQNRKIIITCGVGGVGKTTVSAALAIRAALLGKKAIVVTIDPAKRLANCLGLNHLSDQATDLTPQISKALANLYPHLAGKIQLGTLAAVVPDTRQTFETFVQELAPNPGVAERVMSNPIYQIFAKEFSGTNEYMALERLLALYKRSEYDCIILDTPPSRNTLSFLDAPHLLARFFDEKLIRWLVLPTNRFFSAGIKKALGVLESLTGAGFMSHLFEFSAALFEVQVKFSANLKKITQLLSSKEVGFALVAAPSPEAIPEIRHFINALSNHQFHFDGIILNRTLGGLPHSSESHPQSKPHQIIQALQKREETFLSNLLRNPLPLCAKLPELARDIHSVEDLFHVAMALDSNLSFSNPNA